MTKQEEIRQLREILLHQGAGIPNGDREDIEKRIAELQNPVVEESQKPG